MKEFICLSCWETFELSGADIRGKATVTCPHCGAEQDVLDDVVGLNEGNLDESDTAAEDPELDSNIEETAVDDLLSEAGIETPEEDSEETNEDPDESVAPEAPNDAPEALDEAPGIEFDPSDSLDPAETLIMSDFDPLDVPNETLEDESEETGIELLDESPSEPELPPSDEAGVELFTQEDSEEVETFDLVADEDSSKEDSEEVETFDLVADEDSLKDLIEQETDPTPISATTDTQEIEDSFDLDDIEMGSVYSKENAEENAALSRSVQELVSSITERELPVYTDPPDREDEEPSLLSTDTLDDLSLSDETLNDLEAQFDHAGGLDFDLEGLEVDSETDIELSNQELESSDAIEEAPPATEENEEDIDDEPANDEPANEGPVGFELVSEQEDEPAKEEVTPPIDEDELADAVSDLFDEDAEVQELPEEPDENEKVKSWRVKLKSGLVLSFPSLIVVQGWAADKDTSTISLARGEGEFKPYEQVLGMMQTIETKALNPDDLQTEEEEEEEIIDGLSAAARAAAQRRRDGKMENITAEYQFRKDAFKKQSSSSPKKLFLILGILIVLAGTAVALEFLAIVDLGLGLAPAPPSAPPSTTETKKKKGPAFNVGNKGATGNAQNASKTKTDKAPNPPKLTANKVCASLEKAGVAKAKTCVESKPEKLSAKASKRYLFKLKNLPKKEGQILEFEDKAAFEATVEAFKKAVKTVGPYRYPYKKAMIFVQLNSGASKADAKKAQALLEDLLAAPKAPKKAAGKKADKKNTSADKATKDTVATKKPTKKKTGQK